jgi:hypothetical protein
LGRRTSWLRCEGDTQRPKGLPGYVSRRGRRFATAQIHDRPYSRVTLAMARGQAQKIFAARVDGRDPAEEKKLSRRRLVVDRIDDLVETFIRERVSQIRTATKVTNLLR